MTRSITITDNDEMYDDVINILFPGSKAVVSSPSKSSDKDEKGKEEATEEGTEEAYAWEDLEVGINVLVDFGDDGQVISEITSMPKKNKEQVQVTPQDTGEPEMVDIQDIVEICEDEEKSEGTEKGGCEFAADDEVIFKKGRKEIDGVIRSVDEEAETAKIKVQGDRKLAVVSFDKLSHVEEE